MQEILDQAKELFPFTQTIRRDLHRHPELGFHETRTAAIVAKELSALGLEVSSGIATTGVAAMLEGAHPGPIALVRFDMDALPIMEQTGAEYASENPGVMHACGHDGHVAIGLTVARILSARLDQLHGAVKFVFQPAEEGLGGAEGMIEAGILENPTVDFSLGLHLWNEKPVGWVSVTGGPLMAGAEIFDVTIEGKGGHGALPQETIDPITATAQIIASLQTIVSRNVSPLETAVVSVCQLRAGDTFNVIPQTVSFSGTIRTYNLAVRQRTIDRFEAVIKGVAEAMGCTAQIKVNRLTPAVINNPEIAARLRPAITAIPGLNVVEGYRSMVSDDMAFMMEKAPGCYIMVGSANAERGLNYGHHNPKFDFDEAVLPNAVSVMTAAVLEMLKG